VEVQPVEEARLREVNEVGRGARYAIQIDLGLHRAHRRGEFGDGVGAGGPRDGSGGGKRSGLGSRAGSAPAEARHAHRDHLDRLHRVVVLRAHFRDLNSKRHRIIGQLAEDL
jgi:hypothetical protein